MVTMDNGLGFQRLSELINDLKAIRVLARGLMGHQDLGLEPLEGFNIFGEDGATVFAWQAASPEVSFSTMGLEVLPCAVLGWLGRVPNLAAEDTTKTRNPVTINFDNATMQIPLRGCKEMVVIAHLVRIVVAMSEPDLGQFQDGSKRLFERLRQAQISQHDHCGRLSRLNMLDNMLKLPMGVTANQDHAFVPLKEDAVRR